ncbi:hypothetical protein H8S90_09210 [Olivibacter sp. SDN3]|uniref:ATP-grasp fold amidoligase family protein n=1 Tax=Olivibacter sp. SDN3 TaxID=2764720 RepID=UPI0016512945|nr:ATP-grasp fold amidoligase family protein [Olivibacter sp. SDN3]QNL51730.1 hypothetical protein H8S90_09210 [Olivibacter sp. SDN3]
MIKRIRDFLDSQGELPRRIRNRHHAFWSDPCSETVRNMPMTASDAMTNWKNTTYWQRKLSNKYNAREFAILNGCQVPDLYWKGKDMNYLDFSALPENYVIRPSVGHNSNNVFIMKDGLNLFDGKTYTPKEIITYCQSVRQTNPAIEFLVEEFLQSTDGTFRILDDYKFMCFNGHIATCHVINRLSPKAGFGCFYDTQWNKMKPLHTTYPMRDGQVKPACFDEMVQQAQKLSKAYEIFVRIDFYATCKGAVFGEFTPTPGMGQGFSAYGKKLLISYWDQYCPGKI